MRIQITDPDYENDVETQEDAVVIKEKEIDSCNCRSVP